MVAAVTFVVRLMYLISLIPGLGFHIQCRLTFVLGERGVVV